MDAPFCACGCGKRTKKSKGGQKTPSGQYPAFAQGHYRRAWPEPTRPYGYRMAGGRLAHRQRAEKALGKPLPAKAVVHHADGSTRLSAPLVICENQGYHLLLHARMRVKAAGGDPNKDFLCHYCQVLKPLNEMKPPPPSAQSAKWCYECVRKNAREGAARRRARLAASA